jgi:hypothetical protein
MLKAIINIVPLVALLGAALATPARAAAQAAPRDPRTLLSEQFRTSERVRYVRVAPRGDERARVERRLGRPLPRGEYTFYVATTGARVDGYALFDDERGQHELISFGTFFDARGRITRVEIVAYREPYGDGIRSERFRHQFVGRTSESGFRPDDDIDAISGATISSRAMCAGVKRASVLLDQMLLPGGSMLAAR